MSRNPDTDHILDEAAEDALPRLKLCLTSVAGNLRNFVFERDQSNIRQDDWDQAVNRNAGLWFVDGTEKPIDLKEACNKIIHARSFEYAGERQRPSQLTSKFNIADCVTLTGTQHRKNWTAVINVPQFATGAYIAASILADHGD